MTLDVAEDSAADKLKQVHTFITFIKIFTILELGVIRGTFGKFHAVFTKGNMSRENSKKYPRSVESKNSFLRIRAPENLDIALEGLIRKVLKEQPKMDDIYAFAADYFDMLLKMREKAGIRKPFAQDVCPYHNEDDAHEMVKLASSFKKRTKPHSNTCKALTLRNQDQSKYRKNSEKLESKDLEATSKQDEGLDALENKLLVVKENSESETAKDGSVESGSIENETVYSIKVSGQEIGEEVFIRANEVVTEYTAEDEDSPRDTLRNGAETVGDINELRDKIRTIENEIKRLDNKENKSENDIEDEDLAGKGLEKGINDIGNSDENFEESTSGRDEMTTSLATKTEVEENSVEVKLPEDQEMKHDTVEEFGDADVNTENIDVLHEKEGVQINTENEDSKKIDVEIKLKDVESETQGVNTDAEEKVKEAKSDTEAVGEETQSEAEEVKSSEDDAQKVEETSPEKQTESKETETENGAGILGQDKALQEKEMMGEENLNSGNMKSEILVEVEREALNVQESGVFDTEIEEREDVNSVNENVEVREEDTLVLNETLEVSSKAEEAEKIKKESADGAGRDINITHSAAPVLIASALNGMEQSVEVAEEWPAAEKIPLKDDLKDPVISIATEIENFLDTEREYSRNEKEAMTDGNSVESKIVSRAVSELGIIKEHEELVIPEEDTSGKARGITQDPDDLEADNQEGSTTSDEIEFESSPVKYSQTDFLVTSTIANIENDEVRGETKADPEIIFELNTEDQESEAQTEEFQKEPNTVLLGVPELKLDENIVRKSEHKTTETESVVEGPEDEGVPICGNVGIEIIQNREVEKVELVEGEEDILQVHLTTTVETEQDPRDSVHVEMTSRIDPDFRVSIETKVESPVQDGGNTEKMQLIRAAVVIQNGFRRFKNKKISEERKQDDQQLNNEDTSKSTQNESAAPIHTLVDPHGINNPSLEDIPKRTPSLSETRTLVESQSLDSVRKISPLKTRSLSSVRHGAADFVVWNQLVKELEEAATKIQSNYRGYKSRKKLQRENAIQSATTTSEDSIYLPDPEINHRHTGEFHDSLVLPLDPK